MLKKAGQFGKSFFLKLLLSIKATPFQADMATAAGSNIDNSDSQSDSPSPACDMDTDDSDLDDNEDGFKLVLSGRQTNGHGHCGGKWRVHDPKDCDPNKIKLNKSDTKKAGYGKHSKKVTIKQNLINNDGNDSKDGFEGGCFSE
ncbi:MAG: hypothetical protein SGBAC_009475 [Bacillariaceae sp.]